MEDQSTFNGSHCGDDDSTSVEIEADVIDCQDGCYILQTEDGKQYKLPVGNVEVRTGQLVQIEPNQYLRLQVRDNNDADHSSEVGDDQPKQLVDWGGNAVKLLLVLYKHNKRLVEQRKIKTLKHMWGIIQREMAEKGHVYTTQQVESKWKSLERAFKNKLANNKKTGRAKKSCPYERELSDILIERSSVVPPLVLSATTSETRSTVLEELSIEILDDNADSRASTSSRPSTSTSSTSNEVLSPVPSLTSPTPSTSSQASTTTPRGRSAVAAELKLLRAAVEKRTTDKKLQSDLKLAQQKELIDAIKNKNTLLNEILQQLRTNGSSNM